MKSLIAVCVMVLWGAGAEAADGRPAPEADGVLARFVGQWETQATLRRAGHPPREIRTRGQGTGRRTLEGQYYEFRTQTIPPGESELQVMTYDAAAGVYRQWVFSSDGYRHEAQGTWDKATSTLRWTGKTAGSSFVIHDRFVSPERLEWTLERRDEQGQVLQTIEGTLSRVKAN